MPKPMDSEKKIWPYAFGPHRRVREGRPVRREEGVQPLGRPGQRQGLHHEGGEGHDEHRDEDDGGGADTADTQGHHGDQCHPDDRERHQDARHELERDPGVARARR